MNIFQRNNLTNLFLFLIYGRNFKNLFINNSKKIFGTDKEVLVYKIRKSLLELNLEKNIKVFDIKENQSSKFYNIKKSFHQYLWVFFIHSHFFNMHLILSIAQNKCFFFPLPNNYIQDISKFIKVNFFLSKFLWKVILIIYFLFTLIKIFISFFSFLKITKSNNLIYCNSLANIGSKNLNYTVFDNFFSWFSKINDLKINSIFLHNNKKIKNYDEKNNSEITIFSTKYKKNIDFFIFDFTDFLIYLKSFLECFILLIKCLIKNDFDLIILLFDIFLFKLHLKSKKSYQYALFNNSQMFYRPLWTYAQEYKKKGSTIFYFYSTNNDHLLHFIKNQEYIKFSPYPLFTWPNYILWGMDQLNWLQKKTKSIINHYSIVDYIPFEGEDIQFPKNKLKRICIFDSFAVNDFTFFRLHSPYNIYDLKYCTSFLEDIMDLLKNYNHLEIYLKTKRSRKDIHPGYLNHLTKMTEEYSNLKIIGGSYSAQSLIKNSDLCISIPYTSTALISNSLSVKSIFYDPSGKLPKDSNNFKLIELINGKNKLEECLIKYLKK